MAMSVKFKNVLLCDVTKVNYNEKDYFNLVVYSYDEKRLYKISVDESYAKSNELDELIQEVVCFNTNMNVYDNGTKFKLVGSVYQQEG